MGIVADDCRRALPDGLRPGDSPEARQRHDGGKSESKIAATQSAEKPKITKGTDERTGPCWARPAACAAEREAASADRSQGGSSSLAPAPDAAGVPSDDDAEGRNREAS